MNIGPCVEWTGYQRDDGYGQACDGVKKVLAHRVAYCKANGLRLADIKGWVVRHRCDNKICVRPSHLLIGTHADNVRDKCERNRQSRGEATGLAKLNEAQVLAIREKLKAKEKQVSIAAQSSVSKQLITLIKQKKIWTHV